MKKQEVIISNSKLNSYGFRILTEGIDLKQYERNPILLWMHMRPYRGTKDEVLPLGRVVDLRIDGDNLIGTPVFDGVDEFSQQVQAKWEAGTLCAVSPGFEAIEWSEDKKHMVKGQKYATLTRSKLLEVSICDIGSNDDALKLYQDGELITLSQIGLAVPSIKKTNTKKMEQEKIALKLGLSEKANEAEILTSITKLQGVAQENATLRQELETLKSEIEEIKQQELVALVDAAIADKRISASKRDHFLSLASKVGKEALQETLECLQAPVKPTDLIDQEGGHAAYEKLSDVPAEEIAELREKQREEYIRLYKAEYGEEPVL